MRTGVGAGLPRPYVSEMMRIMVFVSYSLFPRAASALSAVPRVGPNRQDAAIGMVG